MQMCQEGLVGFCIYCDYSTPESHHFADQHSDIYPEVKKIAFPFLYKLNVIFRI